MTDLEFLLQGCAPNNPTYRIEYHYLEAANRIEDVIIAADALADSVYRFGAAGDNAELGTLLDALGDFYTMRKLLDKRG
jgi:hypothetical protein